MTMGDRINPWGPMMLVGVMYDCKISHLGVHCLQQILYKMG